MVVVAIEGRSDRHPCHSVGDDAVALHAVQVGSHDAVGGQEADAVARRQGFAGADPIAVAQHLRHLAQPLAHSLRRVERGDPSTLAVEVVLRLASRKTLGRVGRKARRGLPHRGTLQVRTLPQGLIQGTAVGRHHVADIIFVFQTALDFEGGDTGIQQLAQAVFEAQILQREEVFIDHNRAATAIRQIPLQAAGLAASASVAAAGGRHRAGEEAATAIPHADGSVYEALHLGRGRLGNGSNLTKREGPFQNHTAESRLAQEAGQLGGAHLHLGRGVHLTPQPHTAVGHILHNEGIDPRLQELAGLGFGLPKLLLPDQGVHRGIDPHAVAMGIGHRTANLLDGVRHPLACAEACSADVEGIRPVIDRTHRSRIILGRR